MLLVVWILIVISRDIQSIDMSAIFDWFHFLECMKYWQYFNTFSSLAMWMLATASAAAAAAVAAAMVAAFTKKKTATSLDHRDHRHRHRRGLYDALLSLDIYYINKIYPIKPSKHKYDYVSNSNIYFKSHRWKKCFVFYTYQLYAF